MTPPTSFMRLRRPKDGAWVLKAASLALAVVLALALASGDLILIGLVLGGVAGLMLIERPVVTLGIVVIGVLAVAGPLVMHWPQAARLPWMLALLGLLLMVTAVLHGALSRQALASRPPGPALRSLRSAASPLRCWAPG